MTVSTEIWNLHLGSMILQMKQKPKFWKIGPCTFNIKFANLGMKLQFCTLNDPHFLEVSKMTTLFGAHSEWLSFFNVILHFTPSPPYFRSMVGTCTSFSYSSAPTPTSVVVVLRSPIHANEPSEYNGMLYRTSNRVLNNGIKVIILICMDGTSHWIPPLPRLPAFKQRPSTFDFNKLKVHCIYLGTKKWLWFFSQHDVSCRLKHFRS